ncbi:MAG: DnaD domain protein, partial [Dehalococcoidia bacterium]|nr:DnaD domain protein [Dehalococcoidia bacterium]
FVVGHSQTEPIPEPWDATVERPNIFALYESNIGMLSPMIADELKEAETLYPVEWIEDAFREAVAQNARSWRYIVRILESWEREGRSRGQGDGKSRRYSTKVRRY